MFEFVAQVWFDMYLASGSLWLMAHVSKVGVFSGSSGLIGLLLRRYQIFDVGALLVLRAVEVNMSE